MRAASTFVLILLLGGCALLDPIPDGLSQARTKVIKVAITKVGAPYHYGRAGPWTFDASGLAHYVYTEAGFQLPRYYEDQRVVGRKISFEAAKPGDLLVYRLKLPYGSEPTPHVGIYIGGGEMIHASVAQGRVAVTSVTTEFWRERFVTALTYLP